MTQAFSFGVTDPVPAGPLGAGASRACALAIGAVLAPARAGASEGKAVLSPARAGAALTSVISALARVAALLVAACVLTVGVAHADPHERDHREFRGDYRGGPGPRPGWDHMDGRFHHDQYYPSRGYYVRDLPRDRVFINGPRGRYYYYGGVWYSPGPSGYVVIGAPVGVFVPVLPPYYTTVWVGGAPYYYANDTYYVWRESDSQYEVVTPPDEQVANTEPPAPAPPNAGGDVFIYPKNGQSDADQARDKYECHKWAQNESGFDPTQASGGVPPEQANGKRAAYQRAMTACLEGRGYSVK
jgi:hypothetical protein